MDLSLLLTPTVNEVEEVVAPHNIAAKPYFCVRCFAGFTAKGSLKVHIQTVHEGLRPHQCPKCTRRFGTRNNLIRHERIVHLNQKPYFCGACSKSFVTLSSVNRHVQRKHPKRAEHVMAEH
mmetsp:Transcript_733/g.2401  ORF Transcript_733/g.2401 Transcript_733/m.2401 type:complete len:121 (-) Transcript_733:210-572(-)